MILQHVHVIISDPNKEPSECVTALGASSSLLQLGWCRSPETVSMGVNDADNFMCVNNITILQVSAWNYVIVSADGNKTSDISYMMAAFYTKEQDINIC